VIGLLLSAPCLTIVDEEYKDECEKTKTSVRQGKNKTKTGDRGPDGYGKGIVSLLRRSLAVTYLGRSKGKR